MKEELNPQVGDVWESSYQNLVNDQFLDAHHITDRTEMPNGGYVKENGISLCKEKCHLLAEEYHISGNTKWIDNFHPDDLYKLINSNKELAIKKSNLLR